MARRNERGEGRIGLIIGLALVGAAIFLGFKIVPVRVKAYEFHDFIREEARFGATHKKNNEISERIIAKARALEIPLDKKNLQVERTESEMIIAAKYEEPIDLKLTTYVFKFNEREKAPLF